LKIGNFYSSIFFFKAFVLKSSIANHQSKDGGIMRKNHIIGGLVIFGTGLFLFYLFGPYVVELFKGAMQPLLIIIGLLALGAAIVGEKAFRRMNFVVSAIFLLLGLYGLYDEYYAVKDFFYGLLPPLLIVAGLVSVVQGIKKLT
jgi:hypothetical protein